jgi:RecJ-like exonuclease
LKKFLILKKPIRVISHYDTDGITSAAVFSRTLQRMNKRFSLQIVKGLEEQFIKNLSDNELIIFLDLASNSLEYLKDKKTDIIILDHHEITQKIPDNVILINPLLYHTHEIISGAGVCYLFAKHVSKSNTDLANLAVIGMVGDTMEKNIGKVYTEILNDSETTVKKGLLIYPSTRPLDKALEWSSSPYIPGVTGNFRGVMDLLRDAGLEAKNGKYKSIHELTDDEMRNVITAIMLRSKNEDLSELIGNLYLVKFFNKLEDARELSALINACSRMDNPQISLGFCLGNKKSMADAGKLYIEYKQHLVSALKYASETEKISGKNYIIIHGKDHIKDTIIGTVASIISHSATYEKGSIIIALAYNQDKIKVSARTVGKQGRNVREVLNSVVVNLGGEVGGHPNAAGCLIPKEKETIFIEELRKILDIELVKV